MVKLNWPQQAVEDAAKVNAVVDQHASWSMRLVLASSVLAAASPV